MSKLSEAIASMTKSATKQWTAEKRKADKENRLHSYQYEKIYHYSTRTTIRDAAFSVMEAAYNKASSNGKYYANARQIMYAARPEILKLTGKKEINDIYFTQTLLKDYIEKNEPDWKVVWDARGHIIEPHTRQITGLGGIDIINYINGWLSNTSFSKPSFDYSRIDSSGPEIRFKNVLFIEKEGFTEILTDAGILERYDIALMSTKGIPVKAACDLIQKFENNGVKTFVLHDFDIDGFKILRTLTEGTRLSIGSDVIDLGLRIDDIENMKLDSEPVHHKTDRSIYLKFDCACTPDEINFLVNPSNRRIGERVELNAMTSEQLIIWLEQKLKENGIEKLIPDEAVLKEAYRRAIYYQLLKKKVDEMDDIDLENKIPPKDLYNIIKTKMQKNLNKSWDEVLWSFCYHQNK